MALEALKAERRLSDLAARSGLHPPMMHLWKKALLDGPANICARSGAKAQKVDDETLRALHAKTMGCPLTCPPNANRPCGPGQWDRNRTVGSDPGLHLPEICRGVWQRIDGPPIRRVHRLRLLKRIATCNNHLIQ